MLRGATIIWCVLLLLNVAVDAQRDAKWSWSSNNNRNNIDGPLDRQSERRKYETLEDFRDRYEVNEQTTRKPNTQGDEYYDNDGGGGGRFGFNGPNSITGNGYNSNGFGAFVPQGLGTPNNFNYPPYGNQFNGPYNPGFGFQNNYKPGFNNNFYPNGGAIPPNYGNGQFYPNGFGPNRNPYNPLGNSPANGILAGPGGPTGIYGRPPNYVGQNQLPFNGIGPGFNGVGSGFNGAGPGFNNGFYNNFGGPFNGGFGPTGPNGPIPFNSKSGSGILAESDEPKGRELDKKSN